MEIVISLKVGDWVVAIGSPFSFDFSVTAGIVSAKGRSIQNNNIGNYVPFLQTDVAINPGNSGGPLFDLMEVLLELTLKYIQEAEAIKALLLLYQLM